MSKSTQQQQVPAVQVAGVNDPKASVTRRTVLAGASATAAAAAIGVDTPAVAQDAISNDDMELFMKMSAALTGIARVRLAAGVDPLDIKTQYFIRASGRADKAQDIAKDDKRKTAFDTLMKIARDANLQVPPSPSGDSNSNGIIKQEDVNKLVRQIEQGGDDVKYLARSIVLMWYLGSWYEPTELKRLATPANKNPFIGHEVISPAAYTNGFAWRVVQAHPMGYSDMQFGYWTYKPQPVDQFFHDRKAKGGT
ncbi:hypothetical protein [Bradyrhizobium japonicum]|uniref:hypothetical protein n=1 Tax=Bradyrhizobium japonicum TaxID=375 RepID=UPI000406CA92|nr:hypothetical protein [Bradyrhizobium japonicum]WLB86899.1 hypothetical protein QIH91_29280 [Bradyrhizobium japonicum USDA 135]